MHSRPRQSEQLLQPPTVMTAYPPISFTTTDHRTAQILAARSDAIPEPPLGPRRCPLQSVVSFTLTDCAREQSDDPIRQATISFLRRFCPDPFPTRYFGRSGHIPHLSGKKLSPCHIGLTFRVSPRRLVVAFPSWLRKRRPRLFAPVFVFV